MISNLMNQAVKEANYVTPCVDPETTAFFVDKQHGRGAYQDAVRACCECLVRLECLTDDLNHALGTVRGAKKEGKPGKNPGASEFNFSTVAGGFGAKQRRDIARGFIAQQIYNVTIDQVEALPKPSI